MDAGRELDALVAELVMGWKKVVMPKYVAQTEPITEFIHLNVGGPHYFQTPDGNRFMDNPYPLQHCGVVPHFSTEIRDAWLVMDHIRGKKLDIDLACGHSCLKVQECTIALPRMYRGFFVADADTAPHAICLAALEAQRGGIL